MTKRYKAKRSFWYQPEGGGPEQLVTEGEEIKGASEGKLAALLADDLLRETRAKTTEEG